MPVHDFYRPERKLNPVKHILRFAIFAVLCFFVIRLFLFESYTISGPEMLPGATRGDTILANRFWNGLRLPIFDNTKLLSFIKHQRGDLVFIKHPWFSQSGIAEFFDFLTFSLFGITKNTEVRLVRVLARGSEWVRIAADGTVYVTGEKIPREKTGDLDFIAQIHGGEVHVRHELNGALLYQGYIAKQTAPAAASTTKSRFGVYKEGKWRIAQAMVDERMAEERVYPLPVTNRAQAASIADTWITRTLFPGRAVTCEITMTRGAGPAASKNTVLLQYDASGNLWYQIEDEREQIISVEDGVAWLHIPEGMLFVLNDFREAREDSRSWGPIFEETVTGIPFLRFWPISRFGTLD